MMYWDGDWSGWTWFAMTLSMLVFWTAVGVVIWMLVRRAGDRTADPSPTPSAEEVLRRRYAAGEIDEAEFQRRMTSLRQSAESVAGANR
jgi:putative membrane protein